MQSRPSHTVTPLHCVMQIILDTHAEILSTFKSSTRDQLLESHLKEQDKQTAFNVNKLKIGIRLPSWLVSITDIQ